jgi:predicted aspartyl protease
MDLAKPYRASDYAFLKDAIGNRSIVQLGESMHMSRELPLARLYVLKFLHEELGFDTLALEGYSSIALTRLKTGHLTLKARINGVPGRFVLDTGAGRSVIESARREKFRLARLDRTTAVATGAGGSVALRMSHGNRLQIGDYQDYGFTAYLMPLDQVNLAFLRRGGDCV